MLKVAAIAAFTGMSLVPSMAMAKRSCIPIEKCCKICDEGKACGNSCIYRGFTCHKGRGCACDASALCPQSSKDREDEHNVRQGG